MFTVCPKCALTLVVTAGDLRVAQGYVRCGRCSNVFNALARLSEDRGAAAAAAQNGQASTGVHPEPQEGAAQPQPPAPARQPQATGAFVYAKPPDAPAPGANAPLSPNLIGSAANAPTPLSSPATSKTQGSAGISGSASALGSANAPSNAASAPGSANASGLAAAPPGRGNPPAGTRALGGPQPSHGPTAAGAGLATNATSPRPGQPSARPQQPAAAPTGAARSGTTAPPAPGAPPPALPASVLLSLDDDDIPEDALEFNPDADVNQVFVEPPPNPEWTAATGTFKAIVLKSEETSGSSPAVPKTPVTSGPTRTLDSGSGELNSTLPEDEIELDADFLSATAEMRRLKTGIGDEDAGGAYKPTPPVAPMPSATTSHASAAANAQPTSQAQIAPSARMAPRGAIAEPLAHPPSGLAHASSGPAPPPRPIVVEPPPRTPPEQPARQQPLPRSVPDDEDVFAEPAVVTRAQPRNAVKAFGVDSSKPPPPPPERLALARARVAPGPVELESSPPPNRSLLNSPALWAAGSGALAILLVAQILNHYRSDLAATTQFNKPITALYSALGVQLTPRWDLRAYDVRQLGASVDAASAGQIMVRASVKNGASQAQPMPLLRVTLQDRFGNRIAARDVAPGNYLPRATAATTFLPAGQRIDAEMAFVDPGANAVGFEIDACLPAPAGGIACANDPVSR
jgi:predicted Zn finger-like uncharacterized protein